jgi:hypothetical protein
MIAYQHYTFISPMPKDVIIHGYDHGKHTRCGLSINAIDWHLWIEGDWAEINCADCIKINSIRRKT